MTRADDSFVAPIEETSRRKFLPSFVGTSGTPSSRLSSLRRAMVGHKVSYPRRLPPTIARAAEMRGAANAR
jgi:hypothetical protein